jgi:hypothetical protein
LCQGLHHVKGVAHDRADTTCNGTSEKLEIKGRILVSSANCISDRCVGAEFDTSIRALVDVG